MRTTVTLDADVERLIRDAMKERGISFETALNEAVRAGVRNGAANSRQHFRQKTFRMGSVQLFRWDGALQVADALEDDQLARKLSAQK